MIVGHAIMWYGDIRATSSAIQPADQLAGGTPDEDEFETMEDTPETMSITPSVYSHIYEHGRRYHRYKHGRYPIPNDDIEQAREDMRHAMMLELTDGALFYAPIGPLPQKIIDVGTGTGESYTKACYFLDEENKLDSANAGNT